jgi:PAS domain S-box-containing protein
VSAIKDVMRGERQTRAIVDAVSDAIVTLDEFGAISSFNPAAVRIFGHEAAYAMGRPFSLLMSDESREKYGAALVRSLREWARQSESGSSIEVTGRHKSGSELALELTVSEFKMGERLLFVSVLRDVSERRQVERLKSEFVATVSHELRTPLTSIRGSLGLLAGGVLGPVSPEVGKLIGIAHDNSERLMRMINDILDIEKIESGKLTLMPELIRVDELVREAMVLNKGFGDRFHVRFEARGELLGGEVNADRKRLLQVMTNLLSNAAKFSPEGDVVDITTEELDGQLRIGVHDRGPGIPEAFRARIFGRFNQADSTATRQKGGTGLGLAICKRLIEMMQGRIGFQDREGGGTTFWFELPRHA